MGKAVGRVWGYLIKSFIGVWRRHPQVCARNCVCVFVCARACVLDLSDYEIVHRNETCCDISKLALEPEIIRVEFEVVLYLIKPNKLYIPRINILTTQTQQYPLSASSLCNAITQFRETALPKRTDY